MNRRTAPGLLLYSVQDSTTNNGPARPTFKLSLYKSSVGETVRREFEEKRPSFLEICLPWYWCEVKYNLSRELVELSRRS